MVKAKYANDNAGFGVVLAVDVKIPFRTGQTRILWSDGVVLMADKNYMEVINECK